MATSTMTKVFRYSESLTRVLDGLTRCSPAPRVVKPGRVLVRIGKTVDGYNDVVSCGGDGIPASDSRLVISALSEARISPNGEVSPSLIEELASRGYDVRTLRFQIRKER